jgi:hypothetical protein
MLMNEGGFVDVLLHAQRSQVLTLQFQVSLNEEHAFLALYRDGRPYTDLGERAHHYCLLTLARRRLEDSAAGLDASSQGWIDIGALSRMLGLDAAHVNIQVFRARTQFRGALPQQDRLPELVERRRGEVRLGSFGFRIVRGSRLEGEWRPESATWPPVAGNRQQAA